MDIHLESHPAYLISKKFYKHTLNKAVFYVIIHNEKL